jgi:hypothetical protein
MYQEGGSMVSADSARKPIVIAMLVLAGAK